MPAQHDTGRPAQRHRAPPRPSSTWRPDSGCATEVPLPCSRSAPASSPSPTRQTAASGCRASRGVVVEPTPAAATVPPLAAEAAWRPSTFYPPNRNLHKRNGGRGGAFHTRCTFPVGFLAGRIVRAPFRQNSVDGRSQQRSINAEAPTSTAMVLMLVLPAWGFVATPAVIRAPTVPPLAATALCVDGGVLSNVQAWLPTIIVGIAVQQYAFKARRRPSC